MLEQELFDLLEGTSDAAFAVTDQGEICSWNKAAEKLFAAKHFGEAYDAYTDAFTRYPTSATPELQARRVVAAW